MTECEPDNTLPGPAYEPHYADIELPRLPQRRDDLHVEQLDGEGLVYDPLSGAVHRLNATTFFVWNACDGSQSAKDIAQTLTEHYTVEIAEAMNVVSDVVARLYGEGLLEAHGAKADDDGLNEEKLGANTLRTHDGTRPDLLKRDGGSAPAPRTGTATISRRELLGGGVTKAMLAAPVISTFFAAGAHASGPSASAAFGAGGCKTVGYSCTVNSDCCEFETRTGCPDGVCCIQHTQSGCTVDADCCNQIDTCNAGVCE